MMNSMLLSIVIPVFNERYHLRQVMGEVMAASLPEGVTRELVVIDDASTDGTRKILEELHAEMPEIRIIQHPVNLGKGAAVKAGIEAAKGDYILIQDADLEYNASEIHRLLEPVLRGEADVVYGSRFMAREYKAVLSFWHSAGNRFLTLLSNLMTDLDLTDMETCYKLVQAGLLKSIPIRSNRFGMEPELTAKLAKRGARIFEVPISYRGRSYAEGKKITWWDGVKAIFTILYFRIVDDIYKEDEQHLIRHNLERTHRFNAWLADEVRPFIGDEVLELEAGMGRLSHSFLPREEYYATDDETLNLDYLEHLFDRNQRVQVRKVAANNPDDFARLDKQFDTVLSLNVLEYAETPAAVLSSIRSVLKPGGRACFVLPHHQKWWGSYDELLGRKRRYEKEEIEAALKEAGYRIIQIHTFNRIGVPFWWMNACVLKCSSFSKWRLKIFDVGIWFWRRFDRFLPWQGLALVVIAENPR